MESFENLFFSYKTFFSVKNLVGDEIWRGKVSFDSNKNLFLFECDKFSLPNEQDAKVCLDFFVKICSNFSLQSAVVVSMNDDSISFVGGKILSRIRK